MRAIVTLTLVPLVFAGLTGCSKTDLTNLYQEPGVESAPLQSVLVVALDRDPDQRRMWEDVIADEFQSQGVLAQPSYHAFPTQLPDSQQVVVVLRRDGLQGAIVTHRLSITQNESYDSGYRDDAPTVAGEYWRRWYHTHYTETTTGPLPGDEDSRYQIDLVGPDARLLWSGTTEPLDPREANKVREHVAGEMVPELRRRGVVPKIE